MANLSGQQKPDGQRALLRVETAVDQRQIRRFNGHFLADLPVQDAPRAWMSIRDRLAITRLASPNSVNSCPWFLDIPL